MLPKYVKGDFVSLQVNVAMMVLLQTCCFSDVAAVTYQTRRVRETTVYCVKPCKIKGIFCAINPIPCTHVQYLPRFNIELFSFRKLGHRQIEQIQTTNESY